MRLMKMFTALMVVALMGRHSGEAQVAEFAGSVLTKMAVQEVLSGLNGVIDKARNDGAYMVAVAAMEAKGAIEAWEKANGRLMDKAFSQLDQASRDNFNRARLLIASADTSMKERLDTASNLMVLSSQVVNSIPGNKQVYVLRYRPIIVPPNARSSFTMRVQGTNLDKADLKLQVAGSTRNVVGPTEVVLTIPTGKLAYSDDKMTLNSLPLEMKVPKDSFLGWLGQKDLLQRQVPVFTLPAQIGTYEVKIKRSVDKRVQKEWTVDLGQFKATNARVYKVAKPPAGWFWDLEKPSAKIQGNGEAGRCEGVDLNGSSRDGLSFFAHLDQIKELTKRGPGYVDCSVTGTIYQMVKEDVINEAVTGQLNWLEDVSIPFPADMTAVDFKMRTFDGRTVELGAAGSDQFFELIKEQNRLIIKPRVPSDFQ